MWGEAKFCGSDELPGDAAVLLRRPPLVAKDLEDIQPWKSHHISILKISCFTLILLKIPQRFTL